MQSKKMDQVCANARFMSKIFRASLIEWLNALTPTYDFTNPDEDVRGLLMELSTTWSSINRIIAHCEKIEAKRNTPGNGS